MKEMILIILVSYGISNIIVFGAIFEKLIMSNDSIVKANIKLQKEIEVILYAIDSTKVVLRETENKLEELERKRNEVSNIVDNMDSDGVTNTLSDYLQRRGQNNR